MTGALVTEWSTDDPTIARSLDLIASTPDYTIERYEMEAALHMFQARICWDRVSLLRASKADSARRRKPRTDA